MINDYLDDISVADLMKQENKGLLESWWITGIVSQLWRLGTVAENKDEKTLNILLVHWVNHNQSHEEGFQEWVEKAKAMGKTEKAQCIEKAIEYMNKANEMLVEAKKNM